MNSGNSGNLNKSLYDKCATQRQHYESTSPFEYAMFDGKYKNINQCSLNNKKYNPYDLVDIDTELRGINRPLSKCIQNKYNPTCIKSSSCFSTFDNPPVVYAPEVCPIIQNVNFKYDRK
jgi:hypothetical protein